MSNWFLLPSFQLKEYKRLSQLYRKLFRAPSLELEEIFTLAEEYEKNTAHWLDKQKYKLSRKLCSLLREEELKKKLHYLKEEKRRQFLLWQSIHKNYARSVKNYLKQRKSLAKLEASLFKIIQYNFELLKEMQHQRQKQIVESWALFFTAWEKKSAKASPAKRNCLIGSSKNFQEEKPSGLELMRPYYLALYRFLRLFPANERALFLFHMHHS